MRANGAEIIVAEVARDVSTEVDLASETNAEVVVTGVEETLEAVRAGTWRVGRGGVGRGDISVCRGNLIISAGAGAGSSHVGLESSSASVSSVTVSFVEPQNTSNTVDRFRSRIK